MLRVGECVCRLTGKDGKAPGKKTVSCTVLLSWCSRCRNISYQTRHQLIHDNHHLSGEGDPSFCVCLFQIYYKNLHQLLDEQHNITELQRSESSRKHIDGLKVSDKAGIWQHDKMFSLI